MEVYAPDSFDYLEDNSFEYSTDRDLFENDDLNDLCQSLDKEPYSCSSFTSATSGTMRNAETNPIHLFTTLVESGTH